MKWVIVTLLALLIPVIAYAQDEIVVTAEPPREEYHYVLSIPEDMLDLSWTSHFMNEENEAIEHMSNRNRTFRSEENNVILGRNLLKRLPNMCLAAPTSFDGDWAVGCIFHFEPTPVRAHFR